MLNPVEVIGGRVAQAETASDMELVLRVQHGENEIFAELVHRHERKVYWIVQGILQNEADSEEILQETFLKALQHIRDFRGEAQFSTWMIQIAINEARMRRRKYRAGLHDSIDEEVKGEPGFRPRELTEWRPNAEEELVQKELQDRKSTRLNSSHIQKSRMPSSA